MYMHNKQIKILSLFLQSVFDMGHRSGE